MKPVGPDRRGGRVQSIERHDVRAWRLSIAVAALLACSIAAAAEPREDGLRPIVDCVRRGSFTLVGEATKRWPASSDHRTVATAAGPRRVSVADGYLLVLETGPATPFVNLRIERSVPGSFAADRGAVLAQMQTFSDRLGPADRRLQISERDGIEIMALNEPRTDVAGAIGVYSLFVPRETIVATVYIVNQVPERRRVIGMREYEAMRDRLIDELVACLKPVAR
jgi:hypothetical protein